MYEYELQKFSQKAVKKYNLDRQVEAVQGLYEFLQNSLTTGCRCP